MKVEIDSNSGFCFGVVRAISLAEEALQKDGSQIYSLGDIVHNRKEVQRLEQMGLRRATHEDMEQMAGCRLFVRAHGEPPTTFQRAKELGIDVVDATCPVVAALQQRVIKARDEMKPYGGQVAILGKRGHAEVVGLTGQIEEPIAVIEGVEDLEALDYQRPIYLLSQTTQSVALFNNIAAMIRRRLPDEDMLVAEDTICRRVANREKLLKEFAARHDVIIFVCGKKSSNGKVLYEVCRAVNEHSYNIEEAAELRREWFEECQSVGICGATSTPLWLMEDVARRIEEEFSV
ncbi:MAG: 4-hydroxy-3-methylbut-2-enyl diphosphate reductase [Alistipes sp.]|nr:4-hydroxy-3-methylbut-2-enyl diphosphate reductase [Alistipes sp.]MBR2014165.1 4-hydroxy-3-methylbut-2-enyl diphosphate reductase [Alistipes sp.]